MKAKVFTRRINWYIATESVTTNKNPKHAKFNILKIGRGSGQGAGGPRLFAKKKNASALWRMMANEEIVMETVMLTINVTSTIN